MATVLAGAAIAVFVGLHLPGLSGDTVALVRGSRTIVDCIENGIYSYCDQRGGLDLGAVGPYPPLQYGFGVLLTQLGLSDSNAYKAFSVLSLLGFLGLLAVCCTIAGRSPQRWAAPLMALLLLASPFLYYAWVTFGESGTAFALALLAAAGLRRWPPTALFVCALLACITKETVFPLAAALGAVALWATPIAVRPLVRAHWSAFGAGVVAGVAVCAAFNWLRFHQLTNAIYGAEEFRVPGIELKLRLSVALWLAPNGGTAWYWPLATALVIGLLVLLVTGLARHRRDVRRWAPAAVLVVVMLLQTGTLGSWWSPFGWQAWGPRLMLPVIPAVLLIAVVVYGEAIGRVLASFKGVRLLAAAVLAIAVALPQATILQADEVVGSLFTPDDQCPTLPSILPDRDYFYDCIQHFAWGKHIVLIDSLRGLRELWGALLATLLAGVWLSLCLSVGRRAAGDSPA